MHNNCVYGNGSDYTGIPDPTGQDGNISVDPQLANWPAGDFHLSPGSPCIDAGNTADLATVPGYELDMDGQPRLMGKAVDIGAFEAVVPGYTTYDARYATRAALGGLRVSPLMAMRMNLGSGIDSSGRIDLLDAVRLMRKAAGLEPNP
jgi:hypothetical protein